MKVGQSAEDAEEGVAKIWASSETADAPEEVDEGDVEETEIWVGDDQL